MTKSQMANVLGCLGLACSSLMWVSAVLQMIPDSPIEITEEWWLLGGIAGAILALVASTIGARRWAIAAALPVVNMLVFFTLLKFL